MKPRSPAKTPQEKPKKAGRKSQLSNGSTKVRPPRLTISVEDVAAAWGVSRQTAYTAARKNQIPGLFRRGTRYLVAKATFYASLGVVLPPEATQGDLTP